MKKLLFVLFIAMAFVVISCGEKAETTVDETEKATEVADAGDVQVTQCDGNVCTHVAGSTRECALEGKCPHREQAAIAKAGVGCPHAAECAEAGKCTGKCGGACKGECKCTYCKERHTCTEACAEDCPHAKHVCTGDCAEDCPHAKHVCTGDCAEDCPHAKHVCTSDCAEGCPHAMAAGGCSNVKQATKASGCGGCPRAKTCKSGS